MEIEVQENKALRLKNSKGEIFFETMVDGAPKSAALKKASALFSTNTDSKKVGEGLHLKTPGEFEVSDFSVMSAYLNKVDDGNPPAPELTHLVSAVGDFGAIGIVSGSVAAPSDEAMELLNNARMLIVRLADDSTGASVKQGASLIKDLSCEFVLPISEDASMIEEFVLAIAGEKIEHPGSKINTKKLQKSSESIAVIAI